jgi:hypothetical protein
VVTPGIKLSTKNKTKLRNVSELMYFKTRSIPDDVIKILHSLNPSGRTMALGLTQPLTEMSTRNISWGVKAAGAQG